MVFDEFYIKSLVRAIPDWPRRGVTFRDITPVFSNPRALRMVTDSFVQRYVDVEFSQVAAIDARGFLVGSIVAYALNKPLILVRKKDKLPPPILHRDFTMEYGSAALEVQKGCCEPGDRIVVFDDLIATGHTILTASQLLAECGGRVVEAAAIIDLPDLQGSALLQDSEIPVFALCAFEGD